MQKVEDTSAKVIKIDNTSAKVIKIEDHHYS